MAETATRWHAYGEPGVLAALMRRVRRLSDRLHADGDAFAGQQGWTVTKASGRLEFGARTYRDPRFDQRMAAVDQDPQCPAGRPNARTG